MPTIPLALIPNAPKAVASPTGGNLGRVNRGAAQTLLQQPTLPSNAFQAENEGLQSIARAFSQVGEAAGKISNQLHRDEVVSQVSEAKRKMQQAYDGYMAELAEKPVSDPKTWNGDLEKRFYDLNQKILADDNLSNDARKAIQTEGADYQVAVLGDLKRKAGNEIHNRALTAFRSSYDAALDAGDYDGARQTVATMEANGNLTPEQVPGLLRNVDYKQDIGDFTRVMKLNPEKAKELIADPKKFTNIPELKRQELADSCLTEGRRQDSEMTQRLVIWKENGTITNVESAKQIAATRPGYSVSHADFLERTFAKPRDPQAEEAAYGNLMSRISKLDPDKMTSDEFNRQIFGLRNETWDKLGQNPNRGAVLSFIDSVADRERKPSTELMKFGTRTVDNMRDSLMFGAFDKDKLRDGDKNATTQFADADSRASKVKMRLSNEISRHPEWQPEDIKNTAYRIAQDEKLIVVPAVSASHWFNPFSWGKTKPGDPNQLLPTPKQEGNSPFKKISSKDEADKLPTGATVIGPDGKLYIKQ